MSLVLGNLLQLNQINLKIVLIMFLTKSAQQTRKHVDYLLNKFILINQ